MSLGLPRVGEEAVGSGGAPGALPSRVVSDTISVALGSALEAQLRGWLLDGELRRAIRWMCDAAHRHGQPIEQLLPEFRLVLASAMDTGGVTHGQTRTRLSAQLVAICMDEYYDAEAAA